MMGLNIPHKNPKMEFLYLSLRFFIPNTITNLAKLEGSLKTFMWSLGIGGEDTNNGCYSAASQNHPDGVVYDLDVKQECPVVHIE